MRAENEISTEQRAAQNFLQKQIARTAAIVQLQYANQFFICGTQNRTVKTKKKHQ